MSDIKMINGRYYDFAPKNQSFLLTAKELKALGIKNYYFMLRIDNPRTADIDPFNPNISNQEIALLMNEYRHNMWSFIRTAVRMRTDFGIVPFGLHRGLAAALWCFERHQDHCLCEPRQTWKTTGVLAGPIQWSFQLSKNLTMHFFGKETENTKKNLGSLKDDIELLPEWLQFRKYQDLEGKTKKGRASSEVLENGLLHNKVVIHPKASSLSHAQGLGRGGSGAILYFDEAEHTPYFGEILANSAPLFKTASENAAKAGLPFCRCMSCTPGNLDTKEGMEALPIIKSMIPFSERLYDMNEDQIREYKSAFIEEYHNSEEKKEREVIDVMYIEFQYYQLRKDWNWVLEQFKLSGDKMAIRREILLQRLRGSNDSPIDPEDIEYLISHMHKSNKDIILCNKWRFILYDHGQAVGFNRQLKDLDEQIPYLIGIDPASGGSGDNFAVTIVNPYNLQIAAEFKSPYMGQTAACLMLVELVNNYIPKACIVIERNSMGIYLIQKIVDETNIGRNLYWSQSQKELEDAISDNPMTDELKRLSEMYRKYGTYLTKKVRDAMFELLFRMIAEHKDLINSEYIVDDICKLVRTPTGKIEAVKGEHDDSLLSYLHLLYIYFTGDNLETFGITRRIDLIESSDKLQQELDNTIKTIDQSNPFLSKGNKMTYEEIVVADSIRVEGQTKELVRTLPFVHDSVYSKNNSNINPYTNTVSIDPFFFDSINGVYN